MCSNAAFSLMVLKLWEAPLGNSSLLCPADGSAGGGGAAEPAGRPRVLQHPARAGGGRRGALQDHRVPARGPHHAHGERRARGQQGQDHLHHQRQEVGEIGWLCVCAAAPAPTRSLSRHSHKGCRQLLCTGLC